MSAHTKMELTDLVAKVVGWAQGDEQVEAYAAHSRDADVEVYQGGIETLSTAETDGVGIRVVAPGPEIGPAIGRQPLLGHPGELEEEHVPGLLQLRNAHRTERRRLAHRECHQVVDTLGQERV